MSQLFQLTPTSPPADTHAEGTPLRNYVGEISRDAKGNYEAKVFQGNWTRPSEHSGSLPSEAQARAWLEQHAHASGREVAPYIPDKPSGSPSPSALAEAPRAGPVTHSPPAHSRATHPSPPHASDPQKPAPEPRARAAEPAQNAPPSQAPSSALEDKNSITTFGELHDFLSDKWDRDAQDTKDKLGHYVQDGDNVLLATALASGLDLAGLVFKGSIGWMHLGADLGEGGRWAPLKEIANVLAVPGVGGVVGEFLGEGAAEGGRIAITQARRAARATREFASEVEGGIKIAAGRMRGFELATEGAGGSASGVLRVAESGAPAQAARALRSTGSGAASGAYAARSDQERKIIREIEDALSSTNTWTYEGMRRMLGGKLNSELDAHHLALAMLFRNGPERLAFLEKYVPSVPLSELEHIAAHQGALGGKGINAVLSGYWTRSLSEPELKAAVAESARFYASLGAEEWAAALRKFSEIVFRER